jgi:hypothetical protein
MTTRDGRLGAPAISRQALRDLPRRSHGTVLQPQLPVRAAQHLTRRGHEWPWVGTPPWQLQKRLDFARLLASRQA